jgi:putative Holliday junction resolvase
MIKYPVLAVDYGTKNIGLAISDFKGVVATPLQVLRVRPKHGYKEIVKEISEICDQNKVQTILLGKPQIFEVSHKKTLKKIETFEELLKNGVNLPVIEYDESYSTVTAQDMLLYTKQSIKSSKNKIDSVAAAVFLQEFLNSNQ